MYTTTPSVSCSVGFVHKLWCVHPLCGASVGTATCIPLHHQCPAVWASFTSCGACIPSVVPLSGQPHMHHYTIGVLVVLNVGLMFLTVVGQGFIQARASRKERTVIVDWEGSRDLALAHPLRTIAVTDACSWFVVI